MSELSAHTTSKKTPNGVIIFWALFALYFILYILKRMEVMSNTWLMNYASDLLCMPLTLSVAEWFYFKIRRQKIKLTLIPILLCTAYVSIVFEWLLPKISERYTADFIDVVMYVVGACAFAVYRKN